VIVMSEGKGYYSTFRVSVGSGYKHAVIHGGSYSIPSTNVDFVTWKKNIETGEYWAKLHTMSGKEVRLKVDHDELNRLLKTCGNDEVYFGEEV